MRGVGLLRGINVGGKNSLPMARLVELFEGCGCQDVRTYIQSGNVAFDAPAALHKKLPTLIPQAIKRHFGYQVPLVVRSAKQLREAAEHNPLLKGADPKHLHLVLLADKPGKARAAALDPQRSPPDRFVLRNRELYLHCPNGMARTRLTNAYLDSTLGTVSTVRNWKTVGKLLELVEMRG